MTMGTGENIVYQGTLRRELKYTSFSNATRYFQGYSLYTFARKLSC